MKIKKLLGVVTKNIVDGVKCKTGRHVFSNLKLCRCNCKRQKKNKLRISTIKISLKSKSSFLLPCYKEYIGIRVCP